MRQHYRLDLQRRPNYKEVLWLDKHHNREGAGDDEHVGGRSQRRHKRVHLDGAAPRASVAGTAEPVEDHAGRPKDGLVVVAGGSWRSPTPWPRGRRTQEAHAWCRDVREELGSANLEAASGGWRRVAASVVVDRCCNIPEIWMTYHVWIFAKN
jgi:hypothetical protein